MELLLEIRALSLSFGGLRAVSNFSLKVEPGKIYGVIGPNGAGKTTLFNLVTGLYQPDSGEIIFRGINLVGKKPYEISRLGIARTFQNLRLFNDLTVIENIQVGLLHQIRGLWRGILNIGITNNVDERIITLLDLFELGSRADEKAGNLPYGMQRKLEIARALATQPKLLLLDEPAAGMNPHEVLNLVRLIRDIKDRFGLTILLIEHQMRLVEELCDYITVMHFGEIIARGTPVEVQGDPVVIKAYLGEEEVG
ncbi:ABC transporter ATP-binding protein [Desulfofundulus sp.]|uniref:ABC transporter ATP-binding protein n=1 Tax=Desulfofundulus sp. TaxID=2282750 RepID=UPI003C727A85